MATKDHPLDPDALGLPYAEAGATGDGAATATCPVCGYVATGATHKAAASAYARHFAAAAEETADA